LVDKDLILAKAGMLGSLKLRPLLAATKLEEQMRVLFSNFYNPYSSLVA
jgi:hypothetical protein